MAGGAKTIDVVKGDTVRIVVAADAPDDIHPARLRHPRDAAPGQPPHFRFKANAEGDSRSRATSPRTRALMRWRRLGRLAFVITIAHGLVARSDLPHPGVALGWAAAMVSWCPSSPWPFCGEPSSRPNTGARFRAGSGGCSPRAGRDPLRAIGAALLVVLIYAGLRGTQSSGQPRADLRVVIFWLAFVRPACCSATCSGPSPVARRRPGGGLGGREGVARGPAGGAVVPERLGHARRGGDLRLRGDGAGGVHGDQPQTVAIATLVYSALTFVAMALYGVETWITRGEAFSVYFNLFSRLSPVETRDGVVGLRRPLSGLADLKAGAGTVPLLAVMIGSVTFDGVSEAPLWTGIAPDIARFWQDVGLSPQNALELTFLIGLIAAVLLVYGFYRSAFWGPDRRRGLTTQRLPVLRAHARADRVAYVAAPPPRCSSGPAVGFLAPTRWATVDLFGTSDSQSTNLVGRTHLLLAGWSSYSRDVAGLTLAHVARGALRQSRLAVFVPAGCSAGWWVHGLALCCFAFQNPDPRTSR